MTVFNIYGIGWTLADGYPHEMCAADYDDGVTPTVQDDNGRFTYILSTAIFPSGTRSRAAATN